jgi:hypothetical protein
MPSGHKSIGIFVRTVSLTFKNHIVGDSIAPVQKGWATGLTRFQLRIDETGRFARLPPTRIHVVKKDFAG